MSKITFCRVYYFICEKCGKLGTSSSCKTKVHRRFCFGERQAESAKARNDIGRMVKHGNLAEQLLEAQKGRCWWCFRPIKVFTVDHVIPLSKGGSNLRNNLVASCKACNCRKSDKTPWEFTGRLL